LPNDERKAVRDQKYRIDQLVDLIAPGFRLTSLGQFKVVRILPVEHGIRRYRIQSVKDGHERVAIESELE
jgi:hypothetical protein